MAGERRTRAEKARAQLHRQEHLTYSFQSDAVVKSVSLNKNKTATRVSPVTQLPKSSRSITDLFEYDVHLIYQDLLRTVIITAVILAAVVGIKVGLH
ncbi:hypothetical protein H3C70_04585 [Patescibacteria group bacterium]|nr:hypothetical protein [Patescibacteria group bacterium]